MPAIVTPRFCLDCGSERVLSTHRRGLVCPTCPPGDRPWLISFPPAAPECPEEQSSMPSDAIPCGEGVCGLHWATWKPKQGAPLPVRDMTDNHLTNAIRFMRRNLPMYHERFVDSILLAPVPGGEMAQLAFEGEQHTAIESEPTVDDYPPIYWCLVAEALRRNLIPILLEVELDFA